VLIGHLTHVHCRKSTYHSFFTPERPILSSQNSINHPAGIIKIFKMKTTIISIILIISCSSSLQSCIENDVEKQDELTTLNEKNVPTKIYMKTGNDSLHTKGYSDSTGGKIEETDPPPRDRGQWKINP
jgi:hypothetical protein